MVAVCHAGRRSGMSVGDGVPGHRGEPAHEPVRAGVLDRLDAHGGAQDRHPVGAGQDERELERTDLGQVVLERLLLDFPETVVTVLVRGQASATALDRLHYLLRKPAFTVLRERHGDEGLDRLLDERVTVLEGDFTHGEPDIPEGIDVVIHSAATVSFDPPIDEGFQTNLLGARNLYRGATARNRPHLVHVSTAYVAGVQKGVIPEGQYGAGPVMVWDMGTYEFEQDGSPAEQLARGEVKFSLHGQKLMGRFALIRTGSRAARTTRTSWLLIKRRDEHATRSWNIDRYDWSVLTGRSLMEIAAGVPARRRSQRKDVA